MLLKDLNLKKEFSKNSFIYHDPSGQDHEISVQSYLPISNKIDLIQIALQKAEQNGIYNELLLDMYFHLNIIYLYTDIQFEDDDREDEYALFDLLEKNDIIGKTIVTMEQDEYDTLKQMLLDMRDRNLAYQNTAAAVLRSIIQDLPKNAAAAADIVNSFNPEQYQSVIDFATAANGGRNINTNRPPVTEEVDTVQPLPAIQQPVESNDSQKILSIEQVSKKD